MQRISRKISIKLSERSYSLQQHEAIFEFLKLFLKNRVINLKINHLGRIKTWYTCMKHTKKGLTTQNWVSTTRNIKI